MVRRVCGIIVTLDFIFRLVRCFIQQYLSECIGRHQTAILDNVLQEILETPFISKYVKALIKTSKCENMVLNFSKKVQQLKAFAVLF